MKKIFRKNQWMITGLALLIAVAGYFNFKGNISEEEIAVSSVAKTDFDGAELEQDNKEEVDTTKEKEEQGGEDAGETVLTGSSSVAIDKAAELRLNREQTRAANKATLTEVINNTSLTEEQRSIAIAEITKMTEISEREAACEMMLETKGFEGAVVSISGENADVVIQQKELSDPQRAQIEDIVFRKGNVKPEQIVISVMGDSKER